MGTSTYGAAQFEGNTVVGEGTCAAYKFVKKGTAANGAVICDDSAAAIGAIQQDMVSGSTATYATQGVARITLGATLAMGANIMSSTSGLAVALTAGNKFMGSLRQGGVSGDVVEFNVGNGTM